MEFYCSLSMKRQIVIYKEGTYCLEYENAITALSIEKSKRKINSLSFPISHPADSRTKKLKFSSLQKCINENVRRTIDCFNPGKYLHILNYPKNMFTYIDFNTRLPI